MWDLPGPGLEPVSPALAGRFSTTAPPGKPDPGSLKKEEPLTSSLQDSDWSVYETGASRSVSPPPSLTQLLLTVVSCVYILSFPSDFPPRPHFAVD